MPSVASDRRRVFACTLALFAVNVYIVRELFAVEYLRFMGSIEGAYISLARQLSEHWDLTWWPLWYAGIPYQNTYPPLLHWMTALAARFTHVSPAHAYHFVTAFFYCAGPVTLFWMAYRLSGLVWPSFASGIAYSLFSPSNFLIPLIRNDAGGLFHPRRLQAMLVYGEGPHVASMALLPVAIVMLDIALRQCRRTAHILAAIALAAVVLTNWLGAFALATAAIAYILSKARKELKHVAFVCLAQAFFAYALAARWIPPSTLAAIRSNAQHVGGSYPITTAQWKYGAVTSIALLLLWWWFEQNRLPPYLRFFIVFSFLMSMVTLASAWLQIHIVPQGERYHLEMEMALCPLVAFAIVIPLGRLHRTPRLAVIAGLALLCYLPGKTCRQAGRRMTQAIDVRPTSEYKTAAWIDHNMQDRRVFVPGSDYLWLNAFTDSPQLEGGFDQGVTNPLVQDVHYQMYTGDGSANGGEVSVLWLKAFGVHAVAVSGPRSTEVYKPYHNWKKFDGLLPVLWHEGDDVIYRVLPDSVSLAHVLRPEDRVTRPPASVLDTDFLRAYVAPLEDPALPSVEMAWPNRHHAVLSADLHKDQLLLAQITYHPGWHARVNGDVRRITKDPIGLLLIAPDCEGRCIVDLEYGDDAEMVIARSVNWAAIVGAIFWVAVSVARKRDRRLPPVADHR